MITQLIKLTDIYGKTVYINPNNISQIRNDKDSNWTVVFDKHNESWISDDQLKLLINGTKQ